MKRQLTILILAVLAVSAFFGVNAISSFTGVANADSGKQTFRWLAAAGVVDFPAPGGLLCDLGGAPCPDEATAANGDMIVIRGEGTLRVDKDGGPKKVDGGGTFTHNFADGRSVSGTWEAKQLLMFDSYGPGPAPLPESWKAGRALILVRLEAGGMEADAILEIGCRLNDPGVEPGGGIPGAIEGIRLILSGGQNFNMETDPRSTLFIDITDQDDDDD